MIQAEANIHGAGTSPEMSLMTDVLDRAAESLVVLEGMLDVARTGIHSQLQDTDAPLGRLIEREQIAAHAYAWLSTYVECLRQLYEWGRKLRRDGKFGECERLLLQIGFGEYIAQIKGGIPLNQGEIARLSDIGIDSDSLDKARSSVISEFATSGSTARSRMQLAGHILDSGGSPTIGNSGLDEEMEDVRSHFRRFTDERVAPFAHDWHLKNELVPQELLDDLSELGVFGLTIPEEFGGAGMSKTAMCVVSEELSRGFLGVGSLATRSEIAAELIQCGGTDAQKREWLPEIAAGTMIPAAVFTEPGAGSDLGSLRTRAVPKGSHYEIHGNKTWITHASRANVMTLLARTDTNGSDHRGLSMFIARKSPGNGESPFPDSGISGTEIEVIGYRGMKEYEVAFDGFAVDNDALLGKEEGKGFRHLMETFESARIQTAARAVGVAQSAMEAGLEYATERRQFGKQLIEFPRVASKLAIMAVETMACRQLTYFAARQKDGGRRCDLEAGMAKLLAARAAWAAADNAVQIHGGNGFALECKASRILCDARILSIFEGASEIQANVIAGRLFDRRRN